MNFNINRNTRFKNGDISFGLSRNNRPIGDMPLGISKNQNNIVNVGNIDNNTIINNMNTIYNIIKNRVIPSYKIGILIPTTSKGRNWNNINQTYLYNNTIRTILNTTTDKHFITFYIGIDDDDKIWNNVDNHKILFELLKNRKNIDFKFIFMRDIPKGHLTRMWNKLYQYAYNENCNYFLQCGDDILFNTKNWLDDCIRMLLYHNDIGMTGPVCNSPTLLTQTFVSRKHMEIFQSYFPSQIYNWFCDDWINDVYKPNLFFPLFVHKCINSGGEPRYNTSRLNKNEDEKAAHKNQLILKNKLVLQGKNSIKSYFGK